MPFMQFRRILELIPNTKIPEFFTTNLAKNTNFYREIVLLFVWLVLVRGFKILKLDIRPDIVVKVLAV